MPSCLSVTSIYQHINPFVPIPSAFLREPSSLFLSHAFFLSQLCPLSPRARVSGTSCLFYSSSTLRLAFCYVAQRQADCSRPLLWRRCMEGEKEADTSFLSAFFIFSPLFHAAANARISTHREFNPRAFRERRRFLLGNSALFMSDCERGHHWFARFSSLRFASPRLASHCLASPCRSRIMGASGTRERAFLHGLPVAWPDIGVPDFAQKRKMSEMSVTSFYLCC